MSNDELDQLNNPQLLKIGEHRGSHRIWLDNDKLLKAAGFYPGEFYQSEYFDSSHKIILTLANEGRKVSKKQDKSIIDLSSKKVSLTMGNLFEHVYVVYQKGKIILSGWGNK